MATQPPGDVARPAPNYAESIIREARRAHKLTGDVAVSNERWAIPDGYHCEEFRQIDPTETSPTRARGVVVFDTLASLIDYINIFGGIDTRMYCAADFTRGTVRFDGVLNDHNPNEHGAPARGYQDWRAAYSPKPSPEWSIWTGHNAKPMEQAVFATFLENNLRDIASVPGMPTGTEMLQMALNLEITSDARFRSAVKLQSGGVSLEYVAAEDDATTKRMEVFSRFALGIPPFLGGANYQIEARLKYKLTGGACTFWYELIRPDMVIADATKTAIKEFEAATQVHVFMGQLTP